MTPNQTFDVAVIGGGPHGLTYANWIKQWRPETTVAVIERKTAPGYKVGESLLSTSTRSFVSMGLSMPLMRRLFGNKAGIRFWWTDPHTDALRRHIDVVDIEETFQVERRVLDLALQEATRRRGVTLMTGTRVDLRRSDVDGPVKTLHCEGAGGTFTVSARMVCDASGPAALLARHKGLYRKAPERNQTFTTNAYFAYFRPKKQVPVPLWDEPATRHLCFPGGWLWFINLVSWRQTPEENLRRMITYLLDQPGDPDAQLPPREALSARFGCTTEPLVSIGFTVRADQDDTKGLSVAERFQHYVRKLPAVAWVLDHYELVEDAYGDRTVYHSFMNLVHDSEQMAGDGWCLVGDAAAFTNPLFSPGLNLGSGSCYLAARATVEALERGDLSRAAFAGYEQYMRDVYDAVLGETDLYYRSFGHVDAFEWALLLKLFYGAADVIQRDATYTATDPYVHDLLNPRFRERVDRARRVLREAEEDGRPVAEVAPQVRAVVEPFLKEVLAQPHVKRLRLGDVFTHYTGQAERVEHQRHRQPPFRTRPCKRCHNHLDASLTRCPACGHPQTPRRARRPAAA